MSELPPSKEELQVMKMLQEATLDYGEIQKKINELQKLIKPPPPRPKGWIGNDQKNALIRAKIEILKKNQREKVAETIAKVRNLGENINPEIGERIRQRTDSWAESDLPKKAREIESQIDPELTEVQQRFSEKFTKEKEKSIDLTEEQDRFSKKLNSSTDQSKTSDEKKEALNEFAEKIEKTVEFHDNKKEITNVEEGKKAAAEQERQRKIDEMKKNFEKTRERERER